MDKMDLINDLFTTKLNKAPHGAGRIMSRTHAKKHIDLQDFRITM